MKLNHYLQKLDDKDYWLHFEFIHEGKLNGLIQKIDNNNNQQKIILRSNRYEGSKQSKTKFFGKKCISYNYDEKENKCFEGEQKKENKTKNRKSKKGPLAKVL